jgi:hypothetical protein
MNLPPQVMKIDYVVDRKCTCDTNIVTHVNFSIQNVISVVHIDKQRNQFSIKK